MKHLFTLLFVFAAGFAFAQAQFDFGPDTIVSTLDGTNQVSGHAPLKNNTSQTLNLTWVRDEVLMPSGWNSHVCDLNLCYLASVSTQSFDIGAGVQSDGFSVTIEPHDADSELAVVTITMTVTGDPNTADLVTFVFKKITGTSSTELRPVAVFPNPAKGFFNVANAPHAATIEIFDVLGVRRMGTRLADGNRVDIESLKPGLYFVRLSDQYGRILGTYKLRKN